MLSELDQKRLKDGMANAENAIQIVVHPLRGNEKANQTLAEVARNFEVASACKIMVLPGDGRGPVGLPAISLRSAQRNNIDYLCLPQGHEIAPFIDTLIGLAHPNSESFKGADKLATLAEPIDVKVFITAACPHCPQSVRAASQLALVNDKIQVSIIDAQFFEELAQRYKVRSVPMTIIDDNYSVVGVEPASKLAAWILRRGSEEAKLEIFNSLIETGRFEDAAQLLCQGQSLDHFVTLWTQSTTQIRVGLLLTVEQVLEKKRDGLDEIVRDLTTLLKAEDAALRGDTADLLGQIGHIDAAGPLKPLLDDPNPDVAEIAEESLDAIMERN